MATRIDKPLLGIALKLAAVAIFVAMQGLVKAATEEVPPGEAVFFRSFFAMPVILIWLFAGHGGLAGVRTSNPVGHLWRGLLGTGGMGLRFAGLAILPFAEVAAIGYAAPLFTVIFAAMFIGERVRAFRLVAVGLGLAGVLIVLAPRLGNFGAGDPLAALGAMFVLLSAVSAALAQTFVRRMVETEETAAIVFWFSAIASVLALATLPFGWVVPSWPVTVMLVCAGLMGGVGQVCITSAYRYADAGAIAPLDYASMLLAVLVGVWFFDEVPGLATLAGSALVVAAGIVIILRERRLGLERDRAKRVRNETSG